MARTEKNTSQHSKLNICNQALSLIGSERVHVTQAELDSPTINSIGQQADLHYDCAIQELTRMHNWHCCQILKAADATLTGHAVDSNHFNIPDLRGMFVRGWANTKTGTNDDGRTFAQAQSSRNKSHSHAGSASSTVTDPGHRHPAKGHGTDDDGGNQFTGSGNNSLRENAIEDANTGISVATNITIAADGEDDARPDNIAMMYVIKV